MRTRAVLLATVASFSVLGIGWQLGAQSIEASHSLTASGSATNPAAATPATTDTAGTAGTFVGSAVRTRFGNVQVSVTIAKSAISDVTALQLTAADRKSVQISARAEPILRSEVMSAQSASVQNVSGATYTSNGYRQSLQSALDQAGF